MRQLAPILLTALLLVGTVAGPASVALTGSAQATTVSTNDHLEANDSFGNATDLFGAPWSSLQLVSGESDYFRVHLTEGERLEVDVTFSHADGDLEAFAYAPGRSQIVASTSATDSEYLSIRAQQTGTYYVEINGYNGASAPYSLWMSVPNNDYMERDDSYAHANSPSTGTYRNLQIVGGESDYHAIQLQNGTRLDATAQFDHSVGDLDVAVHAPNQTVVARSASVTDDESLSVIADQTGTWYVEVYGYDGATAPYNLTLSTRNVTSDDVFEQNDRRSRAQPIWFVYYTELYAASGDDDWYSVELDHGEMASWSMDFDHSVGDLDVSAFDAQGNRVAGSYTVTDDERVQFTAARNGTYYIRVYGYDGASAPYTMSMAGGYDRLESNDDIGSPRRLHPGSASEYENLRVNDGEDDYYAVHVDAGETLDLDARFDHSKGDLDVSVYDPSQNVVGHSVSTNDDESVSVTASNGGTYYVRVYGYDGAEAPYDLHVALN